MGIKFPSTDSGLLAWSLNFSTLITASPTTYGLVAGDASAYSAKHTTYATDLAACDPGVRNKAAVMQKNVSRAALKEAARLLASIIDGQEDVSDAQKIELGLTVRAMPSPIPAPTVAPDLDIVSVTARTVKIRLHDAENAGKRGRPADVSGATVFSHVGATPPTSLSDWKFEGNTTRTVVDIEFPDDVAAGTLVWFTAFWKNFRDMSGPACEPVSAHIQYGIAPMAA